MLDELVAEGKLCKVDAERGPRDHYATKKWRRRRLLSELRELEGR
jgi:hypothetical protein